MPEPASSKDQSEPQVPEKCARRRFLDTQSDHMLAVTQVYLYCGAPLWHSKR